MTARLLSPYPSILEFKTLLYLAWDYIWLYICVRHVRWAIKFRNVPILGDLLRRMTMLSGSSDTNANLCLFLRLLYTYCPPRMAFDARERVFAAIFLERQYRIASWIIRVCGMRLLPPLLRPLYMSYYGRATKASEFVHRCLDKGTKQLVILGAGFDSSAYRLRDKRIVRDAEGTTRYMEVFEVDRPSVQERKLKMLRASLSQAELRYYLEGVKFVACEFGVDSICRKLLDAGFDPSSSSAIVWEGVTYYLTAGALSQTLRELQDLFRLKKRLPPLDRSLVESPGSLHPVAGHSPSANTCASEADDSVEAPRPTIFMDYMSTADFQRNRPTKDGWLWDLAREHADALGTSFLSGFSNIEAELKAYGMKVVNHCDAEGLARIFAQDDSGYHQVFREGNATFGHNQPTLALVECEFSAA